MPTPLHVSAFQKFNEQIEDHLEASLAFGLFLKSEHEWAQEQGGDPSEAKYRVFHNGYLNAHEISRYKDAARDLLAVYGNNIIALKQSDFLKEALATYEESASRGHSRFRWFGVLEATSGALLWTIVLIVGTILAAWNGIDLFEYYQKARNVVGGTH